MLIYIFLRIIKLKICNLCEELIIAQQVQFQLDLILYGDVCISIYNIVWLSNAKLMGKS